MLNDNNMANPMPTQNNTSRVTLCVLLALVGGIWVTKGDSHDAISSWLIMVFVIGAMLEGNTILHWRKRLKYSLIIGLSFFVTIITLFWLFGFEASSSDQSQGGLVSDFTVLSERINSLRSLVYALI